MAEPSDTMGFMKKEKSVKRGNRTFILVSCLTCGKTRYRREYYFLNFKHHFCSRGCVIEARRKGIYGKPLELLTKYCSICNIQLKRKPSEISRSGKHFCSRKCQSMGIKQRLIPTNPIRTSNPVAARQRAITLFREEKPCEVCGKSPSQRHHKDGNPSNNNSDNISRLCPKHHIHADRMEHMRRIQKIGTKISIAQAQRDSFGRFISGHREKCTRFQFAKIKQQHDFKCAICGIPESCVQLERDHIIPIALGGSLNASNIQPLCRTCNSKKGKERELRILEITKEEAK